MKQSLRLGLRALVLTSLSLLVVPAMGQNIQLHYDLGRYLYPKVQADRPRMTMTVEQQSLDRFGDTFYFVDMSFLQQGAVSANWKFMRNLRFWQGPLSWHVRYDGGLRFINANAPEPVGSRAISLNDAFMTGVTYTYLSPERRTMLSLTPLPSHTTMSSAEYGSSLLAMVSSPLRGSSAGGIRRIPASVGAQTSSLCRSRRCGATSIRSQVSHQTSTSA